MSLCPVNLTPTYFITESFFAGTPLKSSFSWKKLRKHCLTVSKTHITREKGGPSGMSKVHMWKNSPYWTHPFCREVAKAGFPGSHQFAAFTWISWEGKQRSKTNLISESFSGKHNLNAASSTDTISAHISYVCTYSYFNKTQKLSIYNVDDEAFKNDMYGLISLKSMFHK